MSLGAGNSSQRQQLLNHPSFIRSPVNTILNTLDDDAFEHTSIYDLIDAYCTLSYRMKTVASLLTYERGDFVALQYIKHNALLLGRCVQRDIRRALADPSGVASPGNSSTTAPRIEDIPAETINMARGISTLCQYSLQLVSNILSLPALHALFPERVLEQILNDVLVIARASELPIYDSDKTRSMAAWIFSTSRLPTAIMARHAKQVQLWLNDLPSAISIQPWGCEIIHQLLARYPETFFHQSVPLLPDLLSGLVSSSASVRMDTAVALAGYALARVSLPSGAAGTAFADSVAATHDFMRSQLPRSNTTKVPQTPVRLPDYLARAVKNQAQPTDAHGPRWAIAVICCLTVLSGHGIFTGTRPMKLVFTTLEGVARSGGTRTTNLLACAWKCIIWAFLQYPDDEPSPHASRSSPKEAIFGIARQDPKGGAGACLVAGLLYPARGTPGSTALSKRNLRWALTVLKDLVSHASRSVYSDGVALLGRLASSIGVSAEDSAASVDGKGWRPDDIVVKALFSRHILKSDARTFDAALSAASRFDSIVVRPLTEAEIVGNWDTLVEIWIIAVERKLREDGEAFSLPDALAQMWQSLLLAQTQLTQEHGHLTANPEFTGKAVSSAAHFLEWRRSPADPPRTTDQRRILNLCRQLWTTMRHVFSEAWLLAAAGSLLTSVLQHTFDLSDDLVKTAWSELCSALVSSSAPVLMARLVSEDEEHGVVDVGRELWRIAARQWTSRTPTPSWEETVGFLAVPLRCWSMDEEETTDWTALVDSAVAHVALAEHSNLSVYDALMRRIPEGAVAAKMLETPAIAEHLLSHIRLNHRIEEPSILLQCINTLLCNLYTDAPEHVTTALRLLKQLRCVLSGSSPNTLVDVLSTLSACLALWIADKSELLLVEEYNDAVIPIYCDALEVLSDTAITADTLQSLAHFLYSAFIRMPQPCHGPIAFYEFWTHVHPSLKHLRGSYPEEINTALHACQAVFGSMSSQDTSFDTESHSGSQAEFVSPVKSESVTPRSLRSESLVLQKTPTRKRSPTLSPEIPYEPASSRRLRSSARALRTSPRLRHDEDVVSSDYMPSSPTDAVRARRLAARPASRVAHERPTKPADRPLKRRKLDDSSRTPRSTSRLSHANPSGSSPVSSGSRSKDVSVRVQRRGPHRLSGAAPTPSKSKGKQVARSPGSSPPKGATIASPSSDDYDAWEAPMCDVQELSDVIPDSQPSDAVEDDDDSLLPSYMKAGAHDEDPHSDDTMILDTALLADIPDALLPRHRGRPHSPMRMHTAPADLDHSASASTSASNPHAHEPPHAQRLQRARTASAHLDELRNVYDALRDEGSQLGVGEIAAATELTSRLGALLSEKLSRRLRGEGSSEAGGDG